MERNATLEEAREIMGLNFLGPNELLNTKLFLFSNSNFFISIPNIKFSCDYLKSCSSSHILILGISEIANEESLTLNVLRRYFGIDPTVSEPCFYNQDWYINETFFNQNSLEYKWYLVRKKVNDSLVGINPESQEIPLENYPSALLLSYSFFCWFFHTKGLLLWENEYVWCSDLDSNLDRVYVGRYIDISGKNKNGFSIHRHLKLTKQYGFVDFH
jgi:hypothetical protein